MSNGVNLNLFPLAGLANKTTVHCNESGKMITYKSDRYGFNNPDYVWDEKNIDFVTIGDSFAHGDCVEQYETVASRLQTLSNKHGINLGMGGNGPLLELATLSEYGLILKPKTIYWMYFEGNDLFDLQTEKSSAKLLGYLSNNYWQNLPSRTKEIDSELNNWLRQRTSDRDKYTLLNFFFLKSLRSYILAVFFGNSRLADFESLWPTMEETLSTAVKLAKGWGGRVVFVYIPAYGRYINNVDHDLFLNRKLTLESVRSLKIEIIDLHPCLASTGDPLSYFPFRENGHFTSAGYELITKCIVAQ